MALSKLKKMIVDVDDDEEVEEAEKREEMVNVGTGKMILLEPRAYSESQQIADHLKKKILLL